MNRNFFNAYIVDRQLKEVQKTEEEEDILTIYKQRMERYQEDKNLIPEGNLVEIQFEDFEQHPLKTLRTIY
ncbi:MAG: sulfotransferase [Anaerolineales bacterium]|nr:sulfotransferase [Anaerolineales bacterium]